MYLVAGQGRQLQQGYATGCGVKWCLVVPGLGAHGQSHRHSTQLWPACSWMRHMRVAGGTQPGKAWQVCVTCGGGCVPSSRAPTQLEQNFPGAQCTANRSGSKWLCYSASPTYFCASTGGYGKKMGLPTLFSNLKTLFSRSPNRLQNQYEQIRLLFAHGVAQTAVFMSLSMQATKGGNPAITCPPGLPSASSADLQSSTFPDSLVLKTHRIQPI